MFKHSQLKGLYVCNCCTIPKRDPILFHIPGESISVLVAICKECTGEMYSLFEEEPMFRLLNKPPKLDFDLEYYNRG